MDAQHDPTIREIVVMKSAQVGWTEALNNTIGYYIDQDPSPVLLMQPTLEMADAWSKDRLAPMIRDTPALSRRIADPKSRDSGNTLLHKRFAGGHLTIVGANSPASLASRPIRVLLCDEVDRYPPSAGTEGDPIDLARKRTTTFRNRRILMGGTPTVKGSSRIEAAFDQSDQRFYFVPCPHCGEFQRLIWANVRWPEGEPERACYVCPHCGAEIDESQKQGMLSRAEFRSSKPSTGIAGFHISELYSPWSTWSDMAIAFLKAKKFPETFQTWINTALGETWEDAGEKLDAAGLAARRESYTGASIPAGVLLVTVGTDVQDDRLEVFVYGWGREEEAWRLEHHVLRGDPGGEPLWAEHDKLLRRRYQTDDGRVLAVEATCVDSGGHFTEAVYRYCGARKRFRVWAIKGVGGPGRLIWPRRPSRGGKLRVDLWPIGVDTVKDLLVGRLKKIAEPGPGYFHFDAGADDAFFDQLTSETLVHKIVQGRRVRMWRPRAQGIRQEGLDGTVYAYAALIGRGGADLLAGRAKAAAAAAAAPAEPEHEASEEPESAPERPRTRRMPRFRRPGGWMKRRYR